MNWFAETAISHTSQIVAMLCGLIQIRKLDKATKFFLSYLVLAFLFEVIATYAAIYYRYNLPIINLFDLLQYVITCIYFSFCISTFKRTLVMILIAGGLIIWAVTSYIYITKSMLNTPFLVFEAITIIGLCHYYFYDLLNADDSRNVSPAFGFISLLFIFWSFTFMYWLFGLTLRTRMEEAGAWLGRLIWIINLICYSGFSLVFLFYKKLQNR